MVEGGYYVSSKFDICGIVYLICADFAGYRLVFLYVHVLKNTSSSHNEYISHEHESCRYDDCVNEGVLNKCFQGTRNDYADKACHEIAKRDVCLLFKDCHDLLSSCKASLASQELSRSEYRTSCCVEDGAKFKTDGTSSEG